MPDILRMLGILPRQETGAYGVGGRSQPALDIPQGLTSKLGMGTEPKSFAPMAALQVLTDVLEPQKGGATLAAKASGGAVGTKLAALLGIGMPKRYPEMPGQVDIPLKLSNKAGEVIDTTAALFAPENSKMIELDSLGELLFRYTHGGRSAQSETTGGLGRKGLQDLMNYIKDYFPDKEFLSYHRIGGIKGHKQNLDPSVGVDLKAMRENKPLREVMLRSQETNTRPFTDREKEFFNYRTYQQPDRFNMEDLDDFTDDFTEANDWITRTIKELEAEHGVGDPLKDLMKR